MRVDKEGWLMKTKMDELEVGGVARSQIMIITQIPHYSLSKSSILQTTLAHSASSL